MSTKTNTKPARGSYAKTAPRDEKGRILPKTAAKQMSLPTIAPTTEAGAYQILVLKGKDWKVRTTITEVKRADGTSRPIKDENDALRFGYGIFGTRPRKGEAVSKSGKRFKAVKV